jgi:hypothetical protein
MCRKVSCVTCQRSTWMGCGKHIAAALAGVDDCDRCLGWQTGTCPEVTKPAAVVAASTACQEQEATTAASNDV